MSTLCERYAAAIEVAITKTKAIREFGTVVAFDGAEVYAYPHPRGIAWGVNAAGTVNLLRGICRRDGADEAVTLFGHAPFPT